MPIVDPFDTEGVIDPFVNQLPEDLKPRRDRKKGTLTADDLKWINRQKPNALDRLGAGVRAATREIIPAGGATAGGVIGAEIGALGGPAAPVTVPLGALIGAIGGGLGMKASQDKALELAPKVAKTLGQDPQQRDRDQRTYPVTTTAASFLPALTTGNAMHRALTPKGALSLPFVDLGSKSIPASEINATRMAAERQGVKLPSTMTSPTAHRISRTMPNVIGTGVIDRAEKHAPEAVGRTLDDLAAVYSKPTERGAAGARVQESAARSLETMRQQGSDKIEEANALAKGIALEPKFTMQYLDEQIAEMSKNPSANTPFIKWLSGIKGDLSNPENPLDVGSLRDLRHTLYRQTSPEGIAASDKSRLAGELWTRLTNDIRNGLMDAGAENESAAKALAAFDEGSALWAKRKAVYDKALKKVIGADFAEDLSDPSNPVFVADKSPEEAWEAVRKMTTGDRRAFQKTMANLDPGAQDTVRASVIASLGRNDKGEFVASKFLSEMHQMPLQTRVALFGKENVAAMDDLVTITRNLQQIEPRQHGWGQYAAPTALLTMLGIGGGGAMGAAAGTLGALGINAGLAHVLAKPDSLRWMSRLASAAAKGKEPWDKAVTALGKAADNRASLVPLYEVVERSVKYAQEAPAGAPEAEKSSQNVDIESMSDEELDAFLGGGEDVTEETIDLTSYQPREMDALTAKVRQVESGGNPEAVSPKGAEGTMQVMPDTQRKPGFGVEPVRDDSPNEKERVGVEYLDAMLKRYGNQALALMAYNWGPDNVDKWVESGMKGPVPEETRKYLKKVLGD